MSPIRTTGRWALSGILIGTAEASAPLVVESKPLAGLIVPFSPSLDRDFASGGPLRVFFEVHRKSVKTAVQGAVTVLDPSGAEVARVPWSLAPSAPGGVALTIPLAGVAPGPYRLDRVRNRRTRRRRQSRGQDPRFAATLTAARVHFFTCLLQLLRDRAATSRVIAARAESTSTAVWKRTKRRPPRRGPKRRRKRPTSRLRR